VIIVGSDLHLYCENPFVREWCRYVMGQNPALLVLNGDIADPWKVPWSTILGLQSWADIQTLVRNRDDAGYPTVYIRGNHDYGIKQEYLEGAEILNRFEIGDFEFRHGWERDAIWTLINKPAFWIADHFPALAIRIHKMLYGEMNPKPAVSIDALDVYESWNLHVGAIHTLWREYADRNKKKLIIGHSHCQWNDPLLTDCGALYMGQWVEMGEHAVLRSSLDSDRSLNDGN